ncbi:MAG: chemotaxis protein CheW [Gammaproteobacteria bacterium]
MSAQAAAAPRELRAVLIPTGSERLLLPNSAVSEVIDFREPEPLADAPRWVLGTVLWRQRRFPLISGELLLGDHFDTRAPRLRIALCHSVLGSRRYPFVGLVSRGIPRLVRVVEDAIEETVEPPLDPAWPMLAQVYVNDVYALIPDMDRIERQFETLG